MRFLAELLPGVVLASGAGLGALLAFRGFFPRRPPLSVALDPGRGPRPAQGEAVPLPDRLGAEFMELLRHRHLGPAVADLRITGRPPARHAFDKLLLASVFAVLPAFSAAAAGLGGVSIPLGMVTVGGLALAPIGFVLPDLTLRQEASVRRRDLRFALASYLELVVIKVAAGAGVETALSEAAGASTGWQYGELRHALAAARLHGVNPWEALAALGDELGVGELRELAASVGLAGEHGAKVRASLTAKATSLRTHQLAQIERDAHMATERMSIPVALLLFGFVGFVLYPALIRILDGL